MKKLTSALSGALAISLALTAGLAGVARAADNQADDPIAAIEAVVPNVLDNVSEAGEVAVELPADSAETLAFESNGVSVGIGLPNSEEAAPAVLEDAGIVSYDNGDGSTTVPLVKADGAVQITTVIEGATAPIRYEYPLDLPDHARVALDPAGDVSIVGADGSWIAGIAAPWAKDASGADVPTHFELSGTTLTQVVEHSDGFEYPVVADPLVSYCTLGGWYPAQCVKFTRSEVKAAANLVWAGAGAATTTTHLCSKIPGNVGLVCKVAAATAIALGMHNITTAAREGKCLSLTFTYPFVAQLFAGGLRIVSC